MLKEFFDASLMNLTTNKTNSYPLWYFLNDSLMIIGNITGILVAILFIVTIIRLDHPSYSISNLIACNTSLAIGLTSTMMLINACYALISDFRGIGYFDSFCILRGTLLNIFYIYMYISLCLKAFNRLRCIVYYTNPILKSYRCLSMIILTQWLLAVLLILIFVLTNGIDYDWGSHLCLVTSAKTYQFIFTTIIYYISILFTSGVYLYILHYVLHLPLLQRYRRQRQSALLRRILILLIMLILPGFFSSFLFIQWILYGSIPPYSFKIRSLLDTIGYTGSIITIFVSHTKVRRQYYSGKKVMINKLVFRNFHLNKCELIVLKDPLHSTNKQVYI